MPPHPYPLPVDEEARLRTLAAYRILDTPREARFDDVVHLLTRVCEVPIGLITLVDRDRQWFKAEQGLGRRETPRDQSFCAHAICEAGGPMIVPNAVDDPRFRDNALVVGAPGIRFYAGTPLRAHNGLPLGTLCMIDRAPHQLEERHRETLVALGRQVEALLEKRRLALELSQALEHRHILVRYVLHDLGNALTVVSANVRVLTRDGPEDGRRGRVLADLDLALSNARRILHGLREIEKAERGVLVLHREDLELPRLLEEVARRWGAIAAARGIELRVSCAPSTPPLHADRLLIERVLDNLLANAMDFSPADAEVELRCGVGEDGAVELTVRDRGPGVAPEHRERIFDLFAVGAGDDVARAARAGSGLGLAFCRTAVEAHGGRIRADDDPAGGGRFTVTIPPRQVG
jgi:signal transduction histidine kinase